MLKKAEPKTEDQIRIEAEKIKAMGSPLSLEAIIAAITKKENKKNKSSKKWADREKRANAAPVKKWEGLTIAEINRMNAKENAPSSMR